MTIEGANMIASDFLAGMFGASTVAPVYICSLPNTDANDREVGERHVATRERDHIEAFLRKWDRKDRALYFCTATVKPGCSTRSKATLAELNALHVDIDFKMVADGGPVEIERRLRETMPLPSFVVLSGNGLHAYWCFREALPATDENIARVEALLRLLADYLAGDPACAEVSRLMRLPGSHNTKDGAWKDVPILVNEPSRRYEPDDLADWLEVVSPVIHRKPSSSDSNGHDANNPWLAVASRFGTKPPIDIEARLAAMTYQGASDSGIHATQISVSAALLNRGHPIDEAVEVVLAATHAAAGPFGERWNWRREEKTIRGMCETWLAKHPEIDQQPDETKKAEPKQSTLLFPYRPRPFSEIPLRNWLHAGHYIRQQVVMTVAPGGYGKTSLIILNVIEMCLGRGLIGPAPDSGALRVAYWNAEDPPEEVERRIAAACLHYDINQADLEGQLFLGDKITGNRRLAMLDRNGNVVLDQNLLAEITQFIAANAIDVVIFDPLIAFHRVPESDNVAMEQVVRAFEEIACATNTCVELSQHTRKPQGQQGEITADDSRGASATAYAAHSVRVLNRMTAAEAELPNITPEERRLHLRVSRDKINLVPAAKAHWIRLVSVELPNSDGRRPGDRVQAAEAWEYPNPLDGARAEDMYWARDEVRRKAYRTSSKSPDWFGYALASRLNLNIGLPNLERTPEAQSNRRRVSAIIQIWINNRVLATETRRDDGARKTYEFYVPGDWKDEVPSGRNDEK